MKRITNNDVNKLLVYVLSNEKNSLKENPFRDEDEKRKLKKNILSYIDEQANQIVRRNKYED